MHCLPNALDIRDKETESALEDLAEHSMQDVRLADQSHDAKALLQTFMRPRT